MQEVWKDIVIKKNGVLYDFTGLYQASNFGKIKSCKKRNGKILKPSSDNHGYLKVKLCKNGMRGDFMIHRIVASLFIPNPQNKIQIDHIDTNRANNNVNNLKWATPSENTNNPITIKKRAEALKSSIESKMVKVLQYDLKGNFIKEWKSQSEASRQLKINSTHICRCCKGGLKTAGKFIWKYKGRKQP